MRKALEAGEQVILFLNRRGTASFIQCRRCGFILKCRRCDAALSLHTLEDILVCHHCNLRLPVPRSCPSCSGGPIKFLGAGTQKVEQEVGLSFPHARVLRWDSDVTTSARSHQDILSCFRNHEADILVGTQMVAKGLDVPSVSLVGVINADTGLNLPDFRAAERTFQLLSQVAGRAGRGPSGGRVIIQTFSPEHYAVKAAARHDYEAFYRQEMEFRRRLGYPPFTGLARLAYMHPNSARCQREAERVAQILLQKKDARGLSIGIIGPTPAFEHKLRGRFRWQIVLRGPGLADFLARVRFPAGWSLDIDPVGLV